MKKQTVPKKVAKQYSALHKRRGAWFGVLVAGLFVIQFIYSVSSGTTPQVLGYATNVSTNSLLSATNESRKNNNLSSLKLNQSLSKAAQAKAEDMVAKNYWGHIGPGNIAPWAFFDQVGYKYLDAGENLAYGFSSSGEINTAWMNSDTHRANILGKYTEVGFGYANSPTYQNGNNTVVVAFYGTPASIGGSFAGSTGNIDMGKNLTSDSQHINGFSVVGSGSANWALYASVVLALTALVGFVATHLELFKLGWFKGRKFMAMHPIFDAVVVLAIASTLFIGAGGFIR